MSVSPKFPGSPAAADDDDLGAMLGEPLVQT